jgi:hypothetical protein
MDQGTVYLLHFLEPIGNPHQPAGHGPATPTLGAGGRQPDRRPHRRQRRRHCARRQAQGIGFVVAATWPGSRSLERQLKNRTCAPRYCPICRAQRRRG